MRIFPRKGKYRLYWYVDYYENGRRIKRSYKSKKEAEAFRDGYAVKRLQYLTGQQPPTEPAKISWPDFANRYFSYIAKTHQPQTVAKDRGRFKSFARYLDQRNLKYLNQISVALIAEFQSEYLSDHSRKSCNNAIGLIKTMLNRAVDWELISKNPLNKIKPLKIDTNFNWYSREDLNRIIENCPGDIRDAVIILANTGLRRGELFNLRWRDIDFKSQKIIVRGYRDLGTRTKAGNIRAIPMSATLFGLLMQRRKVIRGDYVCRPFAGENTVYRHFALVLKKLRLPGTLHDLRHTFASHLAMAGVPIPVISELLGHSNIQTTMIYSHLSPDSHRNAIEKLNICSDFGPDSSNN